MRQPLNAKKITLTFRRENTIRSMLVEATTTGCSSFRSYNSMEALAPHVESAVIEPEDICLGHAQQCPWCGGDNQCRVAKGHLYKGPCWCQEMIVPNHILSRLAADRLDPACLCRPCLETIARISSQLNNAEAVLVEAKKAISENPDHYHDERGNIVFTARYHLKRGTCCANSCRHCPY